MSKTEGKIPKILLLPLSSSGAIHGLALNSAEDLLDTHARITATWRLGDLLDDADGGAGVQVRKSVVSCVTCVVGDATLSRPLNRGKTTGLSGHACVIL